MARREGDFMSPSMESEDIVNTNKSAAFRALADAIIPPTHRHADATEIEHIAGAVQLCVDKFVMRDTDYSQFVPAGEKGAQVPLSMATAQLLDMGAEQLIRSGLAQLPLNVMFLPEGGLFAALSRVDRLQTLELLDRLEIPVHLTPPPYQNNPALIQTMMDSLNQLTMFGYYSEWFGNGSTRLFAPDNRHIEFFPPSWRLIGYPGPAFGYRDFRGFLLKYPRDKGEFPHE